MDKDDWELVTWNMIKLLKPGGALQWDECSYADLGILRDQLDSTIYWLDKTEKEFIGLYKHRLDYGRLHYRPYLNSKA